MDDAPNQADGAPPANSLVPGLLADLTALVRRRALPGPPPGHAHDDVAGAHGGALPLAVAVGGGGGQHNVDDGVPFRRRRDGLPVNFVDLPDDALRLIAQNLVDDGVLLVDDVMQFAVCCRDTKRVLLNGLLINGPFGINFDREGPHISGWYHALLDRHRDQVTRAVIGTVTFARELKPPRLSLAFFPNLRVLELSIDGNVGKGHHAVTRRDEVLAIMRQAACLPLLDDFTVDVDQPSQRQRGFNIALSSAVQSLGNAALTRLTRLFIGGTYADWHAGRHLSVLCTRLQVLGLKQAPLPPWAADACQLTCLKLHDLTGFPPVAHIAGLSRLRRLDINVALGEDPGIVDAVLHHAHGLTALAVDSTLPRTGLAIPDAVAALADLRVLEWTLKGGAYQRKLHSIAAIAGLESLERVTLRNALHILEAMRHVHGMAGVSFPALRVLHLEKDPSRAYSLGSVLPLFGSNCAPLLKTVRYTGAGRRGHRGRLYVAPL